MGEFHYPPSNYSNYEHHLTTSSGVLEIEVVKQLDGGYRESGYFDDKIQITEGGRQS